MPVLLRMALVEVNDDKNIWPALEQDQISGLQRDERIILRRCYLSLELCLEENELVLHGMHGHA
jgi:hypothetical protein